MLLFGRHLKKSLDDCKGEIDNNLGVLIVIDGKVGYGKTTIATLIAQYLQPDFNIGEQTGRGSKEFLERFFWTVKHCKAQYKVCIYDEAGDFNSKATLTRMNRTLNTVFDTYRQTKVIVIMCLPRFYYLDKGVFDKGVFQFLLNVYAKRNDEYTRYRAFDLFSVYKMLARITRKKIDVLPSVYRVSPYECFNEVCLSPAAGLQSNINESSLMGKTAILGDIHNEHTTGSDFDKLLEFSK